MKNTTSPWWASKFISSELFYKVLVRKNRRAGISQADTANNDPWIVLRKLANNSMQIGLLWEAFLFNRYCLRDHICNLASQLYIQHQSLLHQQNTYEILGENTANMHRNTLQTQVVVKAGRSLSPSVSFLFSQLFRTI